jgi:hypothetical protein
VSKVSLVAPAIRTEWWLELYDAIEKTNDTEMEFIFVGHIKPDFALPDNFTYIYCDKNPAYCAELAFRAVQTEYVMNIADDYDPRPEHMSNNIVDKCLEEHVRVESLGVKHFFVGPSFKLGPSEEFNEAIPLLYHNSDHLSPVLTLSPLTKIKTNRILGGIDKVFYGLYWDTDVNMRLYEIGGQSKVMGLKFNTEKKIWKEDTTSDEYIYFTERDNKTCIKLMQDLNTDTISRRNRGMDLYTFRNLWNPIAHQGITLDDGRHYFKPGACNHRKNALNPYGMHEITEILND